MGVGTSTFVIRWINFLTMLLAVAVICFGIWMSIHHDDCRRSLTLPVLGLGALILLVTTAVLGNAVRDFGGDSGLHSTGIYNNKWWIRSCCSWTELHNTENWRHLKSCLVKSDDCNDLPKKYKTLEEYKTAELTPIEAGCCRPPSECGYPPINASYFDLSFHPVSSNKDCNLYKNARTVKCYSCDSCKAGVAQYMKIEWRVVAIFNAVLFVILSTIFFVGCCARRNAARKQPSKV